MCSYLSQMKTVMLSNSSLFWYFLKLFSTIFCSGDNEIQAWQVFCPTFCFCLQIWMIWTAMLGGAGIEKARLITQYVKCLRHKKPEFTVKMPDMAGLEKASSTQYLSPKKLFSLSMLVQDWYKKSSFNSKC